MTIIDDALAGLDRQKRREVEILKAVCSVDLDPERRQQLLDALHRSGLLS